MRAVVTGGAGFIGSSLVRRIVAGGGTVHVVDDLSTGRFESLGRPPSGGSDRVVLHHLDVRSPELARIVEDAEPDVVFHLAAQVDVGTSFVDPLRDASVNILGTIAALEATRRLPHPARFVLAASGGSLYGPEALVTIPASESAPRGPLSPYGISKRASIDYLEVYRAIHGLDGCALALANVYGPGQAASGEAAVVTAFVEAQAEGRPLTVYGDGEQTRDFVFVEDVVDAFLRAAEMPSRTCRQDREGDGDPAGFFNIGTGIETSVNALIAVFAALAGADLSVRHAEGRPGELRRSGLDASRAAEVLGWRATTSLSDGLRATIDARSKKPGATGPAQPRRS